MATTATVNNAAYLTSYDGLLCAACAEQTDDLVDGGRKFLASLTPLTADDLCGDERCEECKQALR